MAAKPDPSNGPCVLGIDAAWTAHHPSGVALVQRTTTGWSCLAVVPSYEAFIAQASGRAWDPGQKATGSRPDPSALLQASQQLTGRHAPGHHTDHRPSSGGHRHLQPNAPAPSPISCAPTSPPLATPCTPVAAIGQPLP